MTPRYDKDDESSVTEPTHVLLTGAAGFVGSHMLRLLLLTTDWIVHCPVTFRHHGNPERITEVIAEVDGLAGRHSETAWERVHIEPCDLALGVGPTLLTTWSHCRYVFNIASSSHVDRSITNPGEFIQNNVALQTTVLDAARQMPNLELLLQMSTDEVYGPAHADYRHAEWDTILPSNPYSASKAAQEAITFAYWRTYDLPIIITNTMNIIGERQDPEKFLPLIISKLLRDEEIIVHSSASGESGSRYYLHAANLADAWLYLAQRYAPHTLSLDDELPRYSTGADRPERFNIVGERELRNDELVLTVACTLQRMGKLPTSQSGEDTARRLTRYVDFHSSRPGHDLRYALDDTKMLEARWTPPLPLAPALRRTIQWYLDNPRWLVA